MTANRNEVLQAIAADLDICDMGQVLTKGRQKAKFTQHRKACYAAIAQMNKADGLDSMTADEILAALSA